MQYFEYMDSALGTIQLSLILFYGIKQGVITVSIVRSVVPCRMPELCIL